LRELFVLYDGFCGGREPQPEQRAPYREYIAWLNRQDPSQAETFWKTALDGFSSATTLAEALCASHLNAGEEEEYDERHTRLSPQVIARLRPMMAEHGLALTTLLEGAWALLLSRYCNEQRVVFGVTVSTRSADFGTQEKMLGPLTNTLPILVKVCEERVASAWMEELQVQQTNLRQCEYSSLAQIREWINQPKDQPLFESRLVLDGDSLDDFSHHTFG
jgi:hypothetical protein